MATLTHETTPRTGWRLRVYDAIDPSVRHSLWLGSIGDRDARAMLAHIEAAVDAIKGLYPVPPETRRWLDRLDPAMRERVSRILGAVRDVESAALEYLSFCSKHHKPSTVESIRKTLDQCAAQFGQRPLRSLTADEITRWLQSLNVSSATLGRVAKDTKAFLRWCTDRHWLDPLQLGVASTVGVGEKHFVDADAIQSLIGSLGDPEEKCALALIRWSGLRCPSELGLRRGDIRWDDSRIFVTDTKRHQRRARGPPIVRETPLFPELVPHVESIWNRSAAPTDWLLPGVMSLGAGVFESRVRRARDLLGLSWPRLFHSLRATRATELIAQFGLRAASTWLGNSPAVAARNYELITADTWEKATTCSGLS